MGSRKKNHRLNVTKAIVYRYSRCLAVASFSIGMLVFPSCSGNETTQETSDSSMTSRPDTGNTPTFTTSSSSGSTGKLDTTSSGPLETSNSDPSAPTDTGADTTSDDNSAQANEEMRMELDSADLTILADMVAITGQRPEVIPVAADVGKQRWQAIQSDPEHTALHSALAGSGASDADIAVALQAAAYHGSGQPQDPTYQNWAQLKNALISDARAFMQAVEAYEAMNSVMLDRVYLEEKTQMPSIAAWELEANRHE